MEKPTKRRLDVWLVLEVLTSAGLVLMALLNSVRLWQGFATGKGVVDLIFYWALPVFFELAKNCFFARGLTTAGSTRIPLLLAALFFSLFSLAGQVLALLGDSTREAQAVQVEDTARQELEVELAQLHRSEAAQDRIISSYDMSYRDYAQVVAAASAEKARLEARATELRAGLAAPVQSDASQPSGSSAGAFYEIVRATGVEAAQAAPQAARLRSIFLFGVVFGIEYGGLFMLALALTHGRRGRGRVLTAPQGRQYAYVEGMRLNHIVTGATPHGDLETACGRVFSLKASTKQGPGSVCPACLAREE